VPRSRWAPLHKHNKEVPPLTFAQARETVLLRVSEALTTPRIETVDLLCGAGRVLAEDVAADRDTPPTSRSVRDGFAIRAADACGDSAAEFELIGESRAGASFEGTVGPHQAVEIMTGAAVPRGADAIIMVEHVERRGERINYAGAVTPGQFINPRGCEAVKGEAVLCAGTRLDYTGVAMLAAFGFGRVQVFARPTVAILATGDEIVALDKTPQDFQIRNSNAYSLAAQVIRAGGTPKLLPIARDTLEHTAEMIELGLRCDLLLLSGGVSAGKYDVVEPVLAELGAEFFFDRVLIQPGQPVVFGRAEERFFFGLPGNPSSTMVTFEIFARAALELLSGQREIALRMPWARLTREFRHRAGITRFLPAQLGADGGSITPIPWQGSGDIPSMTRAEAYLVALPEKPVYEAGDWIQVLPK
jgi:molybdopterin molybdotransferase